LTSRTDLSSANTSPSSGCAQAPPREQVRTPLLGPGEERQEVGGQRDCIKAPARRRVLRNTSSRRHSDRTWLVRRARFSLAEGKPYAVLRAARLRIIESAAASDLLILADNTRTVAVHLTNGQSSGRRRTGWSLRRARLLENTVVTRAESQWGDVPRPRHGATRERAPDAGASASRQ